MKGADGLLLLVLVILLAAIAWGFTPPNTQANIVQGVHSLCVLGLVIFAAGCGGFLLIVASKR